MRAMRKVIWGLVLVAVVALLALLFVPMGIPTIPPPRATPLTFTEALRAFDGYQQQDASRLNPVCEPVILHHGAPTPRVYVLLHGLSNCPAQFRRIAETLHAKGHTVIIPRMPHHGLADRLNEDYGRLTLTELAQWLGGNLEIARGMGRKTLVAGLSVSGISALWIAAERPEVSRVISIAPFFAPHKLPVALDRPLGQLVSRLPNVFIWWNPIKKQDNPGPPHAYPRFPTRVVGQFMVLGATLRDRLANQPPAVQWIRLVMSDADFAISHQAPRLYARDLKRWPKVDFQQEWIPREEQVPHDMVDPTQPNQRLEFSEPLLLRLLEEA